MRFRGGLGRAALGVAISVVALALVFRTVDVASAWETLKTADPRWVALLFALRRRRRRSCGPSAGASCCRRSRAVPFPTTLASLLVGYLANNVLPARLGEVVRSHDLGTRTGLSAAR